MSKATASYPDSVWDGSSATRAADVNLNRAPVYEDWDQVTAEVQAIETDLIGSLDGFNVGTVADANVIGGIPVLHQIAIGNSAGDTDVVLTHKTRIVDVWAVKTNGAGASGDTVTLKNGTTNAITNALSLNAVDKSVVRVTTIDDAQHEVAAGGTLRATAAKNTDCSCILYVLGIRVA